MGWLYSTATFVCLWGAVLELLGLLSDVIAKKGLNFRRALLVVALISLGVFGVTMGNFEGKKDLISLALFSGAFLFVLERQKQNRSKYRLRTRMRGALPYSLIWMAPKGADCGDHEWYNRDGQWQDCYHCRMSKPFELD